MILCSCFMFYVVIGLCPLVLSPASIPFILAVSRSPFLQRTRNGFATEFGKPRFAISREPLSESNHQHETPLCHGILQTSSCTSGYLNLNFKLDMLVASFTGRRVLVCKRSPRTPLVLQVRAANRHRRQGITIDAFRSFSQLQSHYPDDHEYFRYTTGRWLRTTLPRGRPDTSGSPSMRFARLLRNHAVRSVLR